MKSDILKYRTELGRKYIYAESEYTRTLIGDEIESVDKLILKGIK